MSRTQWQIDLTGNIDGKLATLSGKVSEFEKAIESAEKKVDGFRMSVFQWNQISTAIQGLMDPIRQASEGFVSMDRNMKQLKMMTQASDATLNSLKEQANELAKAFGADPADAMAGFLNLMNKFGPEIAENEAALTRITSAAFKLSKTMDGDVQGAFEAVTTMANQFGVDMQKPAEAAAYIEDILAKLAKSALIGSEDIQQVSQGMAVVGNSSKEAGAKMSETLAMLQILDRYANKRGAEGGTIARNIFGRLQKGRFTETEVAAELAAIGIEVNQLADNTVPLIDKLRELQKLSRDPALLAKMFDEYNVAPLKSILANLDELEQMQQSIKESSIDDLDIMSASVEEGIGEKTNRMRAAFQVLKNDLMAPFSGALPFMEGTASAIGGILMFAPGLTAFIELSKTFALAQKWTAITTWWANFSFMAWTKRLAVGIVGMGKFLALLSLHGLQALGQWIIALVSTTAAQSVLNAAMAANPIGALVVGLTALVGIAALVVAYWDDLVTGIKDAGKWIINLIDSAIPGFKDFAKGVLDFVIAPFKWVGKIIDDLKDAFGSLFGGGAKRSITLDADMIVADADMLTDPEVTNPFFTEKIKGKKGRGTAGISDAGSAAPPLPTARG